MIKVEFKTGVFLTEDIVITHFLEEAPLIANYSAQPLFCKTTKDIQPVRKHGKDNVE